MIRDRLTRTRLHAGISESGFSLIELMIAVAVIVTGLVSIAAMSGYVSRTNSTSNTISLLATSAQDQADKLRMAAWDQVTEDTGITVGGDVNFSSSDANHSTSIANTPVGTINVSWKVVAGPSTTGDMRTITIKAVQVNAPPRLANGVTVSMIICKD
jgi:prepilin-type N-terminal cleavage/methylation domain-containing protein